MKILDDKTGWIQTITTPILNKEIPSNPSKEKNKKEDKENKCDNV